ncbi:MAG: hypothetical protein CMO32_17110, partial [Variovorax sp.]|nr:hypothetical protein [Variovorax sp.]
SRTGRPDEVGVIGVAVFRERVAPPPPPVPMPFPRRDGYSREESAPRGELEARNKSMAPSASASADSAAPGESSAMAQSRSQPAPSLGTGHGRRETSYVGHTTFERLRSSPDEVVRIRYDSRENLVAAGVIPASPAPRWPRPAGPSPFPASEAGYVPDPPPRY